MTATGCVLGLAAGVRHALEPDHLAAVSTFMSTKAHRTRVPVAYAAAWGAGHALVLVLVGAVLFLSSDASAFITGQSITIDGGLTFL